MSSVIEVLQAALSLPSPERAALAHQLIISLEPGLESSDVSQPWADEIRLRQRAAQDDSNLRDWDEALRDLRKSLAPKGQ